MTISLWDGHAEQPLDMSYWDGTVEHELTTSIMPLGAWSVAELLRRPGAVLPHRAGRVQWAEYSMAGLTQSVWRGVDGLEIAVARTLDGVWFGLHDRTLLRTSGVDIDPVTLTWAEVQAIPNEAPSGGDATYGNQPYARIEDLLTWANTHATFLDLKYQAGEPTRDELMDMVEDLIPNARSKIVIKFASGDAVPVATWARNRGYQSWGHFRPSDWATDPDLVITQAGHWDLLGLDADAPQAMWDALADLGRPILGADCTDREESDLALSKGAIATIVGDVIDVLGTPEI